ncbi:FAS1-like dehydratase domain-containing protein [Mycobacterium asiaticum]|uniref:FAS1-like dehydratase domain-containing protein n=1 Tax=Mycobacterium asiaticum TaxID=1790 RepID=UPI000AC38283|nr:MaoC family dehydratase N-terminal domain-containing protein [Mycobacterium asiaticum]
MSTSECIRPAQGVSLAPFSRVTDLPHWNRYAAVNDEFIDVHMSVEAARAAGQPDIFGMGNLRVGYQHAALHRWIDGRGDIASYSCQFRALNFPGDELTVWGQVVESAERDGLQLSVLELGVRNQDGAETTPATAEVVWFDGPPAMPGVPAPSVDTGRAPGVYLDPETIGWLGRPLPVLESLPVDANDIRRWAQAIWYPEPPPADQFDIAVAALGPWGGLVAPRDFNPYAWHPDFHPEAYPWMRGMGTEPGRRGLNGGQRTWYGAPIRPGDVISSEVTLVSAYEKEGRLGTMLFLVDRAVWSNQRGELVRTSERTTIYH